jgi:hypothetical protein
MIQYKFDICEIIFATHSKTLKIMAHDLDPKNDFDLQAYVWGRCTFVYEFVELHVADHH